MIRKSFTVLLFFLLVSGLLFVAAGCTRTAPTPSYPYSPGDIGPGGVIGPGGMMGSSGGMMGPGGPYRSEGQRISIDQATWIVQNYLQSANNPDIQASEIMEFQYNFYVQFVEKSTGVGAFEALIEPYTGDMYPEPGPNLMWNTRYGAMSGMMWGVNNPGPMTITEDQAKKDAQDFLKGYLPGSDTETPDHFYGYYTLHILQNGKIYGMLSVNGYTGQVWFHSWHGQFINMKEF